MERLQKVIAEAGICSRRKAEELITKGLVSVNGHMITELGTKVNENDAIVVDGKPIRNEKKEYYLLNKPRGYICSVRDEHNRPVVTELIGTDKRIYPIGRLDFDTTGLLLLTNDGELANILMHPKNGVTKEYLAKIDGNLTMEELFKLKNGIMIDKVKCIPTRVKIRKSNKENHTDRVVIGIEEGRNHIVKRIFEAIGHNVIKLNRERYGFLDLGKLQPGEYRELTIKEVKKLYAYKKAEKKVKKNIEN